MRASASQQPFSREILNPSGQMSKIKIMMIMIKIKMMRGWE